MDRLSASTDRMLDSYCDLEHVGHLDRSPLPSSEAVVELTRELKQLLFPGFHQRRTLKEVDAVDFVATRLESVQNRLFEQVACTLTYADEARELAADSEPILSDSIPVDSVPSDTLTAAGKERDVVTRTDAIVHDFLLALPRIRRLLATDVQAAYDGDPAAQ